MCKKNIKSDKNKSKLTYYLRAVGPENLSIAWHFLTKMILYNVVSDRENKSERPVDALAVKTSLSHLLTTWNQEMLAHLKRPQLLASRLLMLLFFLSLLRSPRKSSVSFKEFNMKHSKMKLFVCGTYTIVWHYKSLFQNILPIHNIESTTVYCTGCVEKWLFFRERLWLSYDCIAYHYTIIF